MCESLHRKKVVWFWIYEEHLLLKHWCDFDTNQVEVCPFLELTKLTGHFIWTSFGKMVMPKFWLRKKEIIKYTVYSLHYMLVERNFLWLTRTANSGLFFRNFLNRTRIESIRLTLFKKSLLSWWRYRDRCHNDRSAGVEFA